MKRKLLLGSAVLVVGLLVCASSASAALTYFDAQILDIVSGKTVIPKNTVQCAPNQNCAETSFTALPFGPGTEGPPPTTDPAGNWTQNGGTGSDGLWNRRNSGDPSTPAGNFGNPAAGDPSLLDTVFESRGQFDSGNSLNTEDPAVLKTTIQVPQADRGQTVGVYVLFWDVGGPSQIAACLECVEDEFMPLYVGQANDSPAGYVFDVYDVGGIPMPDASPPSLEMDGFTSTDAAADGGNNRRLNAAWLGNVVLGDTLTVYVGDGPPAPASVTSSSHNYRTWYDGIAYGDVQDLTPLACVPEPATLALVGLGLAAIGLMRRRS